MSPANQDRKIPPFQPCSSSSDCGPGLHCGCFIPNRGQRSCRATDADYAFVPGQPVQDRQGLSCDPTLPDGARPMAHPPPIQATKDIVLLSEERGALGAWARSGQGGGGFFHYYTLAAGGLPVLALQGVPREVVRGAAEVLTQLLGRSARRPKALVRELAGAKVRVALAPSSKSEWQVWDGSPEVSKQFATGLGGGSRLFPTTGAQVDGSCESWFELMEEVFHSVQYIFMQPTDVCLYHVAYQDAVEEGRYHPQSLEEAGEPVPTLQADEYFASAFLTWFGKGNEEEFEVPGNGEEGTGRQHLQHEDPLIFCLLAKHFWANDTWTPCRGDGLDYPNAAVDYDRAECEGLLSRKMAGCPPWDAAWPGLEGPASLLQNEVLYRPTSSTKHLVLWGSVLGAGVCLLLLFRGYCCKCQYWVLPQNSLERKSRGGVSAPGSAASLGTSVYGRGGGRNWSPVPSVHSTHTPCE